MVDDADRRRRAQQHRQQVAPGGGGIVELHGRAGQPKRLIEALLVERLGAQPLGVGGPRRVAGLAALVQGDHAGHERERQQGGESGQHSTQAANRLALALGLLLGLEHGSHPGRRVRVR